MIREKLLNELEGQVAYLNTAPLPTNVLPDLLTKGASLSLRDFQEALVLKESPYWIIMKHINYMRVFDRDFDRKICLMEIQQHLEDTNESVLRRFVEETYGFKYITVVGDEEVDLVDLKWNQVIAL